MYEKSKELFEKAKKLMPGGVNSPVRAFGAVGGTPLFIKGAKGAVITDADGNSYIDYVCSWGPGILGHAFPPVIEAVRNAAVSGLTFGAPTENEVTLAKMIQACVPSMEMLRMVSSGTEAVMSAVRAARGFTGRDLIVKFTGCYHGHSDGLLVKAGSGALTQSAPDSAGVPADFTRLTLLAEFNNEDSVQRLFDEYPDRIAALVVEPVGANMGVVPPEAGFLEFLREITAVNGTVLIFDEVITGFRLGLGGAQEYFGVTPDMTTMGKIVGGGMPMGVYGGKREIMENVAPMGAVYQAGTLSGNPIATAAGIATLRHLMSHPEIYTQIEEKTRRLEEAASSIHDVCVRRAGSLMSVFFTRDRVRDYTTAKTSDTKRYARYFWHMLGHGIYTAPSQFEAMFVSAAHTDDQIRKTCGAIKEFASLEKQD